MAVEINGFRIYFLPNTKQSSCRARKTRTTHQRRRFMKYHYYLYLFYHCFILGGFRGTYIFAVVLRWSKYCTHGATVKGEQPGPARLFQFNMPRILHLGAVLHSSTLRLSVALHTTFLHITGPFCG